MQLAIVRRILSSLLIITATVVAITASTYAAFTAQATISGISFSTGRAELKLFGNMGYTHVWNNGNLTKTLPGVGFEGIGPDWKSEFALKYFNTGSVNLLTSLRVEPKHGSEELAQHIMIEIWLWNDKNGNGKVNESNELTLLSEKQPLSQLETTPVPLGQLDVHEPRGLLLKFSTEDMPSSTQDKSLELKFILDGTTQDAVQDEE